MMMSKTYCVVFIVLFVLVPCLVYPMLPVFFRDYPFLISPSVFSYDYLHVCHTWYAILIERGNGPWRSPIKSEIKLIENRLINIISTITDSVLGYCFLCMGIKMIITRFFSTVRRFVFNLLTMSALSNPSYIPRAHEIENLRISRVSFWCSIGIL